MENLWDNAKGKTRIPNMKTDHELLWVTEKVHGKVLEIRTGHNRVGYLPMLVNEQTLLRSLTLWTVKAILIDSVGFMMRVETLLT